MFPARYGGDETGPHLTKLSIRLISYWNAKAPVTRLAWPGFPVFSGWVHELQSFEASGFASDCACAAVCGGDDREPVLEHWPQPGPGDSAGLAGAAVRPLVCAKPLSIANLVASTRPLSPKLR